MTKATIINIPLENNFAYSDFQRCDCNIDAKFFASMQSRSAIIGLSNIKGRTGLLAVSIKNHKFTNQLVSSFIEFCDRYLLEGIVTIVDKPYERNLRAAKRVTQKDDHWLEQELEKLHQKSSETWVRVNRMLKKTTCSNVRLVAWGELQKSTPEWLVAEVWRAWEEKKVFYRDIRNQTAAVIKNIADDELDAYAEFLLEEIPVLLHQYYFGQTEVVDIYPGAQQELFWKIEANFYAEELPLLSARIPKGRNLIYMDWQEINP